MMYFLLFTPPKMVLAVSPAFAATSVKYAMGGETLRGGEGGGFCGEAGVAERNATIIAWTSTRVLAPMLWRIFCGNMSVVVIRKQYNRTVAPDWHRRECGERRLGKKCWQRQTRC